MTAKDRSLIEKKVAISLRWLPSYYMLVRANTKHQCDFGRAHRQFWMDISLCWEARVNGERDPLRPLLESGEIELTYYNRIYKYLVFFQRLWELVQISFDDIQSELKYSNLELNINSPFKWYKLMLLYDANYNFSKCLLDYSVFRSRGYLQALRQASKFEDGKFDRTQKEQYQKLLEEQKAKDGNFYYYFTLYVCSLKSTRNNPVLQSAWRDFRNALSDLRKVEKAILRNTGSHSWVNGIAKRGDKTGIYK